jgi:nitrogen fixation/metabolism regulation signal transduction histidine kinase
VLRHRLIAAFVIATVLPLAATIWIATALLDRSLGYATTAEIDELSRTLEGTVRRFYQREREALREEALAGRIAATSYGGADPSAWPDAVRGFWESGERERFGLAGPGGNHVEYMRRGAGGVDVYSRGLGGIRMDELSASLRETRQLVDSIEGRDLRRGFTVTLLLLVAAVWMVSLVPVVFIAHRISRPIQRLTAGLTDFAAGDWDRRVEGARDGEIAQAIRAFNDMAEQLRQSRERLVYLTQMSSWQSLARKTAHELKNSLTPIRLTIEEILARHPSADRTFMDAAAQIVVSEVDSLERRVRAFSEFAGEPPVNAQALDINALVNERVALLRRAHVATVYQVRLDASRPMAHADADLVKGIFTNLLENAAEAARDGGTVLAVTRARGDDVVVDVHDSGPGISREARATLFEPTITFKKHGMGLGLSIAKKNALLYRGDITLVESELGGAAFRGVLPRAGAAPAAIS